MKKDPVKIVLSGGHAASTAFAFIQEVKKRKKKWKIFFLGTRSYVEGHSAPTIESQEFPKLGVNFIPIFTGRLQRKFSLWTIPSIFKIPFGFIHAFLVLKKIKPNLILSFGGYSAFPVVVVGYFLKIPIIIHEQTSVVGRANRYSSFFAKKIAISRESSRKFFKKDKVVLTGNPISEGVRNIKAKIEMSRPPLLFITGGKSGSITINSQIQSILPELIKEFKVVHQVGSYQYQKFLEIKNSLPQELKNQYQVYETISPFFWPNFLSKADIIVSRAGANIVSEIIACKRPSILIPLPFSYLNEQMENALFAERFGIAKVIDQSVLTPAKLYDAIREVKINWKKMINLTKSKNSPDLHASSKLVDLVSDNL